MEVTSAHINPSRIAALFALIRVPKYGPWEFLRHHSMKEFNGEIGICMATFFLLFLGYELCLFIHYIASEGNDSKYEIFQLMSNTSIFFKVRQGKCMHFHITCIN
jgi:hypothetical protein